MSYQPIAAPPPPPPVAPPAPRPPSGSIKPSKAWYWIGGLLIAAGILTAIGLFVGWAATTSNAVDNFARVRAPLEGQEVGLDFKKAGEYRIYYEWRSEADGQRVDNSDHNPPSDLKITMGGPDGAPVNVQPDDEDFSFSFNDKLGRAIYKIDIPAPGSYTMQVATSATDPFVIAVGKGVLQTIWPWWLLGIIGSFILGVGLGLLAIILTAVKRGRRKREWRRANQQPPPGYATLVVYPEAYAPVPVPVAAAPVPEWTPPPPTAAGWGAPGEPTPTETVPTAAQPTETVPTTPPPSSFTPPAAPSPEPLPAPASTPPGRPDDDSPWGPPQG